MYPYLSDDFDRSDARDLTRVDAACLLDREVESARERFGCDVSGHLVECSPSAALLGAVQPGDLLVMGSDGHERPTARELHGDHGVDLVVVQQPFAQSFHALWSRSFIR